MQNPKEQLLEQLNAYLVRQGSDKVVFVNPDPTFEKELVIATTRFFYGNLEALRGDLKTIGITYNEDVSDSTCLLSVPLAQPQLAEKVEKFAAALAAIPPKRVL